MPNDSPPEAPSGASPTKPSRPPPVRRSVPPAGPVRSDAALHSVRPDVELKEFVVSQEDTFRRTLDFEDYYDAMSKDEARRVDHLWMAVRALEVGQSEHAAAIAESLVRVMPDEEDGSAALPVRTFGEALLARIRGVDVHAGGNLYLRGRPPGAQLRAFDLLRQRTPLIPFAYAAANRALLSAIPEEGADVTIVDVGIGRGTQIRSLLKNPAARQQIRSLLVVGVEPDSSEKGVGALQMAEETVLKTAVEVGIPTEFCPIAKVAEDLSADDILDVSPRGVLLCNAAFALHHIAASSAEDASRRRLVLRALAAAGVDRIVLTEPDSNHFVDDFASRFLYAYRHYGTVYRCLCSVLPVSDAALVWHEFFAPEVRNVTVYESQGRTERHEETLRWVEHLEAAGFEADHLGELLPTSAVRSIVRAYCKNAASLREEDFDILSRGPATALHYRDISLIGVVRARRRGLPG